MKSKTILVVDDTTLNINLL